MARKSKKKAKRGSTQRRHLHPVPPAPRPPRELLAAGQVLDSFTPDFVRWFGQEYGESDGAMDVVDSVGLLMAVSLELTGSCSATEFSPATVRTILEDMAQWGEDDVVEALVECLHIYLHFLDETGRWSGPAGTFEEAHGLAAARVQGGPPDGFPFEIPDLDCDEEAAAFAGLPLIQRTSALLSWLGTGKDVTSTGVLRLKDVGPAAETMGVHVQATWNAKRPEHALPGFGPEDPQDPEETEEPLVVRSMHEVPVLSTAWSALRGTGLITLGSTRVRPGEAAGRWLHGTAAQRVEVHREFTAEFLRVAVLDEAADVAPLWRPLENQLTTVLVSVLLAGCTEHPIPRERIELTGKGQDELQEFMAALLFERVRGQLDRLAELGLASVDTHYRVPPVVVRCAVAALGPDDVAAGDTAVAPLTYQLKIGLRGAKPPIWRRVLVPSTMHLDAVHDVIQSLFEWEGHHLHLFSTGDGYSGTRYGPPQPPGPLGGFGEDDSIDESTVALGALLKHVGDRLTYLYDFGDDWYHDITLESIDEAAPAGELPCCTGGRGAAPAEDSGGVWGWAGLVAAVNDPDHPEHEDLRDWLGLRSGEQLDPKAFDVRAADAALEALRRAGGRSH